MAREARGAGSCPGGRPAAGDELAVAILTQIRVPDCVTVNRRIIERRQIDAFTSAAMSGEAIRIFTGAVPQGADTVFRQEDVWSKAIM